MYTEVFWMTSAGHRMKTLFRPVMLNIQSAANVGASFELPVKLSGMTQVFPLFIAVDKSKRQIRGLLVPVKDINIAA